MFRCGVLSFLLLLVVSSTHRADAQEAAPLPLFRLFLTDGQVVTTYGEYARVDRSVVASVLLDVPRPGIEGPLATVTLPVDVVDWERSDAYAHSVRRALYAASTAERDYAAFTEDVARTLDRVSSMPDPLARIALVEQARARLIDWPDRHYGYRQDDVDAMRSVLDEILAGLRASAGQQRFTLVLSTGTSASVPAPLLPAPSLQEIVSQALGLSRHVTDATERVQLLTHVAQVTDGRTIRRERWARDARRVARRRLTVEHRTSRAYQSLRGRILSQSAALLDKADVRSLMSLREEAARRDDSLGRQRPAEMASLLVHLDAQIDSARRRRLAIDRWEVRRPVVEAYVRRVGRVLDALVPAVAALEDVKALAGPSLVAIDRVEAQLAGPRADLRAASAPGEAAGVQALVESALQMSASAFRNRRLATLSEDVGKAWDASAAAAGALLMIERARTELGQLLRVPTPAGGRPGALGGSER